MTCQIETPPSRRRGRPTAGDVAEIDRRIRNAAMTAFCKLGFAAAQMESIASEAGVSKAALYRRYANKSALLTAIIGALAEESFRQLQEEVIETDPVGRLKAIMRLYRAQRQDERGIELARLIASSVPFDPTIGNTLDEGRIGYVQPVDHLIEEAIAMGMIRTLPVLALREAMFDLLVNGAASQRLLGMTPDDDRDVFEFRWQLLMDAVRCTIPE